MELRKLFLISISFLISCGLTFAADFPQQSNFVNDYTSTLSSETVADLNLRLKNYETETGTEIAVAVISSTEGMPIWQYATELGNEWGVGKADVDNGAILVIAVEDRELFIATGSQLEGALTDIEAREIIKNIITPSFKSGNFDTGVLVGVEGMITAIKKEGFTNFRTGEATNDVDVDGIIFWMIFFILPWLAAMLGRSKAIWPGAVIGAAGGGISGWIFSFALWGIGAAVIGLGVFGLLFDRAVSRNYQNAKRSGGSAAWWAGGNRGGRGGFGGFGGFGGGGFSGGGSGGSW